MFRSISTRRREKERGFVLLTMSASAIALVAVLGLSVDVGRTFIAKNETQAYCDSAALAAALKLDGTTAGIANAQAAVAGSANTWNFKTTAVANPTVTFATSAAGPWLANPNPATNYGYARVASSVNLPLYFLPIIVARTTQNVISSATAAQVSITSIPRGLAPYTLVSTNPSGPNFGLTVGSSYDIQWPNYNGTRSGCRPNNPDRCFVSPPCVDDSVASRAAVVSNWGASISGYWGGNSNNTIREEVLNLTQLMSIDVGANIFPILTSGNKAVQAVYLDERASQDNNSTDNLVGPYLAASHNGRRLMPVPVVNPTSTVNSPVLGYAQVLLVTNGASSNYYRRITNGNDPFCALYAGPYVVGGTNPGVGGPTGASAVKLIQ